MAKLEDAQEIYEVVKAAYDIERGNTGISFKNADRYISTKDVIEDLPFIWILKVPNKNIYQEGKTDIVGCVKAVVNKDTQIVELGPIAVLPDCQVGSNFNLEKLIFLGILEKFKKSD